MDPRTRERVEQWESRPFSGDRDELDSLVTQEFSGAVSAAGTWLFVLNGRVVGVIGGDIDDVLDASGTVYEAPDPALPLLGAMTERGGETRASYYTNKTPLSEVDRTLQEGSFTGYVELSEQVLSGDYYAVYYGGRRMSVAYIGNAERLLTGEEAFERADDEVGIYEVIDVPIEVTDLPGDEPSSAGATPAGSEAGTDPGADEIDSGTGAVNEAEPGTGADSEADSGVAGGVGPDSRATVASDVDQSAPRPDESKDEIDAAADEIDDAIDETTTTDQRRTIDAERPGETDGQGVDDGATASNAERAPEERGVDRTAESSMTDQSGSTTSGAGEDGSEISTATGKFDEDESGTHEDPHSGDETRESVEYTERTGSTDPGRTERSSSPDPNGARDGSTQSSSAGPKAADESGITTTGDRADATKSDRPTGAGDDQSGITTSTAGGDAAGTDRPSAGPDQDQSGITTSTGESAAGDSDAPAGTASDDEMETDTDPTDARFKEEERWRETRRIPSIDPETTTEEPTSTPQRRSPTRADRNSSRQANQRSSTSRSSQSESTAARQSGSSAARQSESSAARQSESSAARQSESQSQKSAGGGDPAAVDATQEALRSDMLEREDKIDQLTQRVTELEARRDELEAARETLAAERDELREENEELSATADRLRSRIDELETELERLRAAEGGATAGTAGETSAVASGGTQLDARQALAETNVFVRYGSKSEPTLTTAHDGDVDRETVAANLRLERHTGFDAASAVVDGQPYDEFVESRMEYRFLDWLVRTLLYEIRETGHADALADLYDVIPRIDRVELDAVISLADDDTEDVPDEVRFDVVAFDKRGTPLVVANCNDARDPASREMLESIERDASAVNANYPELGAAFVVTSSFFDPGALELAETATSGGFLSRGSKLSYVNLSRKQGYHLCLVEARSGGFHLTVPEL